MNNNLYLIWDSTGKLLCFLTSDFFWFIFVQIMIFLVLVVALYFDFNNPKILRVKRNIENKKMFFNFWILVVTVILFSIFQISSYPNENKLIFYIFDISSLGYLSVLSPWFTNKLVVIKIKLDELEH
jgi:hypothetical protein